MSRARLILDSTLPIMVGWVFFTIFAVHQHAHFPRSADGWLNIATFVIAQSLFLLEASLLIRRMRYFDWFTFALAFSSVSLMFLFGFGMALILWPELRLEYDIFPPSVFFRVLFCISASLTIWLLSNTKVVYHRKVLE